MSRDELAARFAPTQQELERWDREVVWHGFSQMSDYQGLIIQSARGCWLTTIDGQRVLDGASSMWCNVHGHTHPSIDEAIIDQLKQVAHVTSLGMSHPTTIRLAKRLTEIAPTGLNHVFFSSDGASAVEVAMKLAVQYWHQCPEPQPQRDLFLTLGDAYHGDTLGTCSVSGVAEFIKPFHKLLFSVLRGPCPQSYRTPPGVDPTAEYYLAAYEKILRENAQYIAAIIVEPIIQCAAGVIVQPPGFLEGIAKLAKRYQTLLIADEVAVGLGRTGKMFASQHESVQPDLLCLGKGLTGGYLPMSATLCSTQIWQAFSSDSYPSRTFFHGHTFGGNPLAAAAALATLELFEIEATLDNVQQRSEQLACFLDELAKHPDVGDVRQKGLIAAVELVADKATKRPYTTNERRAVVVCRAALERDVWLRPLGNVIPIVPPLSISESELAILCQAVRAAI